MLKVYSKKRCSLKQEHQQSLVYVIYNIKLEKNIWRKGMHLDMILIDEASPDNKWLVQSKEPCLSDDLGWLDECDGDIFDTRTGDLLCPRI